MGALRSNSGCMPPLPAVATPRLVLARGDSDKATMGLLTLPDGTELHTLERLPTNADHPCVPAGEYRMLPYNSPSHGETWCLHNPALSVWAGGALGHSADGDPSRPDVWEYIELHVGNYLRDTLGCILVGMSADPEYPAVWSSRDAMEALRNSLGRKPYNLTITYQTGA